MRALTVLSAIGLAVFLTACSAQQGNMAPQRDAQFVAAQLAQLDGLPCPAGCEAGNWAQLKGTLRAVILHPPRQAAGNVADTNTRVGAIMQPGTLERVDGWFPINKGDYNQDGVVTINDLTPLGAHFQESSGGGAFPFLSIQAVIDGDSNGELNIADLTPLGANLGHAVTSYNVYASDTVTDVPDFGDASTIAPIANVPFSASTGNKATQRLFFPWPTGTDDSLHYIWVKNNGMAGEGGDRSTVIGEALTLALTDAFHALPPGSGTSADPYIVLQNEVLDFTVALEFGGDVGISPHTSFAVTPPAMGSVIVNQLNIDPAATGAIAFDASFADFTGDSFPVASNTVFLNVGPPNDPPVADLQTTPTSGPAPLTVDLDASGSTDSDGTIVSYEWDFDGDGTVDDTTGGGLNQLQHDYLTAGTFTAKVRVIDDLGGSDEATVDIDVQANAPPTAVLTVTPDNGLRPVAATLDAASSTDDGTITSFDWDLDGDGTFETPGGTNSTLQTNLVIPGTYEVGVQVTDDLGATATATHQVDVTGAWNSTTVAGGPNGFSQTSLIVVNGQPAIAFGDVVAFTIRYVRASDVDGLNWGAPVTPDLVSTSQFTPNLMVASGNPALLYSSSSGLTYIRALDTSGATWGLAQSVGGINANSFSATVIDSNPAVAYRDTGDTNVHFLRSDDPAGATWLGGPVLIDAQGALGGNPSLTTIGGQPAFSYWRSIDQNFMYVHGGDADGTTWSSPAFVDAVGTSQITSLAEVDGRPAIGSNGGGSPRFSRGLDSGGQSWPTATILESGFANGRCSMAVVAGLPAMVYQLDGNLRFNMALDADGNAWGPSETIDAGDSGSDPSLLLVNGHAAVAYVETTDSDLVYAVFF